MSDSSRAAARMTLMARLDGPVLERAVSVRGVRTAFLEAGDGPPVILLHGAAAGGLTWGPVLGPLAVRARVLAPDLPGYGDSDKPSVGYTRRWFTAWLAGFLDALGLERVALVGGSQGGAIAIQFAADHPGRVHPLVVVCAEGLTRWLPPGGILGFVRLNTFPSISTVRFLARYLLYDAAAIDPVWAEYVVEVARKPGANRVFWRGLGRPVALIPDAVLRRVVAPTLVVWGRENRFAPLAAGERAQRVIPHARLEIIDRCGHLPYLERPEELAGLVSPFLDSQLGRQAPPPNNEPRQAGPHG